MKILRLYALVDIARYQSNFSEYEGKKSDGKEWWWWCGVKESHFFT